MAEEETAEEQGPLPAFDPRDFTAAEWGMILSALVRASDDRRWRAEKPGRSAFRAEELRAAADRRWELSFKVRGARKFRIDQQRAGQQ